ncbi:MAG: aldo/keto reductase [Phycisphaerae bacterium]|jgi:hypothetical protein
MSDSNLTRREFFQAAGVLGAGALLSGSALGQTAASAPVGGAATTSPAPGQRPVPRRKFGKTGVEVPILALGGIFDTVRNQAVLKKALAWGITYWDTAQAYDNSEQGMGMFLEANPSLRKEIFLVTKAVVHQPEAADKALAESLEWLKTDYVDMYFLHGAGDAAEIESSAPAWKAWAEKAKKAGKIKFFGFSTHSRMEDCLQAAAKVGFIDAVMLTYNFRLMHTDKMKAAVEAATQAGIGLTAMKTQAGKSKEGEGDAEDQLIQAFVDKGYSDKQAKLKAVWENPQIASICSQMASLTVMAANYAAALDQTQLSAAEKLALKEYASASCSGYCAGCSNICQGATGGGLPIADVMRFMMYFHDYGMTDHARGLFAALPASVRSALAAADYSAAARACPQGLDIAGMMKRAGEILA